MRSIFTLSTFPLRKATAVLAMTCLGAMAGCSGDADADGGDTADGDVGTENAFALVDTNTSIGRAEATWNAVVTHFLEQGSLFRNSGTANANSPPLPYDPGGTAGVWPYSEALAAGLRISNLSHNTKVLAPFFASGLPHYAYGRAYNPHVTDKGDNVWFDDNSWIGLDLTGANVLWRDPAYATRAAQVFDAIMTGRQSNGAVIQTYPTTPYTFNTCTNGPASLLALWLYNDAAKDDPNRPGYLEAAKQMMGFVNGSLLLSNNLYRDKLYAGGIQENGTTVYVDDSIYSYNQGVAIGANLGLSELTESESCYESASVSKSACPYMYQAMESAKAAAWYFSQGDNLWNEEPVLNAIFFRFALPMDAQMKTNTLHDMLHAYTTRAWNTARNAKSGLFDHGGLGKNTVLNRLIDQAAMAELFALDQAS